MPTEVKKEIRLEIAHVLFIDVVGYSKLLVDEQRAVIDELNRVIRQTDEYREAESAGHLIKIPTGDGMALVFYSSPESPVECALEIGRGLKEHPKLRVRMGVHSGPVSGVIDVNERANVAGAGINFAQRVMDCGDGGHILLSKRVSEDLEHYGHWRPHLHDLGECEVKHGVHVSLVNLYTEELGNPTVPEKVRLAQAAAAKERKRTVRRWAAVGILTLVAAALVIGFVVFRSKGTSLTGSAAIAEKSIAVLPFANLSSDKENAYFADGIQDEILTRLSKIADLKVISRTSTQHYKSAPENLPEIARQLGVAHIVEGSVQKSSDTVRVNVQLIKAMTDSHLWADIYDRKLTDIFLVESDVAKAIADQLRAHLTGQEEQVISAKPTDNPAAYDAYLRGLAYTLKTQNTPANYLGAQKHLREAARLDPKFALSWALLSYVDARGYRTSNLQPTPALREEARQASETALTLNPNLGEAWVAKGYYNYGCESDFETAIRCYERARQFLPNSSRIPESLALVARNRGQWDQSEAYFNEAERLDPRNVSLLTQHGQFYLVLRRFPEAVREFNRILEIVPGDIDAQIEKAAIAQAEGDLPRASALLAPLHPAADDPTACETLAYQAILERRSVEIIPRLTEILAKADPELGYLNGEMRFWLGWAQEVAGDEEAAQETWREARGELEALLKEQPKNCSLIQDLALIKMGLGDKASAFALVEGAMALRPIEKDAANGPQAVEILARVAARMKEPARAIAALQEILSKPGNGALATGMGLTPALLRLDPMFDSLRNDPRFQQLVSSSAPKAADKSLSHIQTTRLAEATQGAGTTR